MKAMGAMGLWGYGLGKLPWLKNENSETTEGNSSETQRRVDRLDVWDLLMGFFDVVINKYTSHKHSIFFIKSHDTNPLFGYHGNIVGMPHITHFWAQLGIWPPGAAAIH